MQAANRDAIRQDLEQMVARWHELREPAVFEVRAFAEHKQLQTARFKPDWIADAVDWIASLNALGFNVYVVRNPIRATVTKSASDADIIASFYLWADCDDETSEGNVRRFDGPRHSHAVVTGRTPHTRVHVYWELDAPVTDMGAWRAMQADIAAHFGSDSTVINPSRIMRIAGTVAHPAAHKRARGYITEICEERDGPGDPVPFEQMRRVFAHAPEATSGAIQIDTGGGQPLDRERLAIQAMSGAEWHNAVIRLVASYVAKGLSDSEIHALTAPLTLDGYTVAQTQREVQTAIDGARRKGWAPEPQEYAQIETDQSVAKAGAGDGLEWFDDLQPAMGSAYIVKGMLDAETMSVVYGPSNSGKTFFAIDLAFHIAIGAQWRGRRVNQAGVLYLAAEGGRGIVNRVVALREQHGICDVPMAVKRAGLDLLKAQADLQSVVDLASVVKARAPHGAPVVIIIDTLSRVMAGGDENSAQDMTALIRNIDAIRAITGAHIMLVHHTGKDTARGARGHSSLRAATDTEIEVAPPSDEGQPRMAMVTKQRDHNGGEVFAFTLKNVILGTDQDGDDVVTCIVEEADSEAAITAAKAKKGLGGNQKLIADTFDQMLAEGLGTPNPGGVGFPEPGKFWCVDLDELRRIARGKMVCSDTRSAFNQAMSALTGSRGIIMTGGNMAWRTDRKVKQ